MGKRADTHTAVASSLKMSVKRGLLLRCTYFCPPLIRPLVDSAKHRHLKVTKFVGWLVGCFEDLRRFKAHLQLVVRVLRSCALCVHFESTCKILVVDPTWNIQSDFLVAGVFQTWRKSYDTRGVKCFGIVSDFCRTTGLRGLWSQQHAHVWRGRRREICHFLRVDLS